MNYLTIPEAAKACGMTLSTAYRVSRRLKIVEVMYGRHLIPKSKIPAMKAAKQSRLGNPRWIESPEAAAAAGRKGGRQKARNQK